VSVTVFIQERELISHYFGAGERRLGETRSCRNKGNFGAHERTVNLLRERSSETDSTVRARSQPQEQNLEMPR